MQVDGYAGRVGIYEYINPDGTIRRELRPADEVGKKTALDSFEDAPITNLHPTVAVTAGNSKVYSVGHAKRATMDGANVATAMTITDKAAIEAAQNGRDQLSPGYELDYDPLPGADKRYAYPGNPEGRYDGIQKNIIVNHLALVDRARGGNAMKLRLDEREFELRSFRFDGFETGTLVLDAELDADARDKLRDSQFAYPEEGKLPINDTEHVQAAMSRYSQTDFSKHAGSQKRAFTKIVAAAKAHGIDSTNFQKEYGDRQDHVSNPQERTNMGDDKDKNTNPITPSVRTDEMFRSLEAQLINKTTDLTVAQEALKTATSRADAAEGQVQELKKTIPILQAEVQQARAAGETVEIKKQRERADAAETALTSLKGAWGAAIRARVALERRVAPVHPEGFRMDGLDDDQLMRASLKRLDSGADISPAVSSDTIRGKLEARLDMHEANARSLGQIATVLHTQEVQSPKERHDAGQKERWRKPLPNAATAPAGMKR